MTDRARTDQPIVRIADYPTYAAVRAFLGLIEGATRGPLMAMRDTIGRFIGGPEARAWTDWSDPGEWIGAILTGEERTLARHLWEGSEGLVNPRELSGIWALCASYGLLVEGDDGLIHVTPLGRNFIENPEGEAAQYLDYSEGLLHLLASIAEHGPGKRADLIAPFAAFMAAYTRIRSQAAISARWADRVANLVDRGHVRRDDVTYQIAPTGMLYLERAAGRLENGSEVISARAVTDLRRLLVEQHAEVRRQMADALRTMDPYRLERLVRALLSAMGYERVQVTRRSGDGGVDVAGDIRVGITEVREVVQVKRQQGNIQRPVLDQLRGSLHRFKALRGTIITTGRFSRGAQEAAFEAGAAPITLIDGERLIDLLIKHEIGARKSQIEVVTFVPADFAFVDSDAESASEASSGAGGMAG